MRQFVLTRSAYGPAWELEANRRRLEMTQAVTIPTLLAQTERRWTWIVLLHPRDELLAERQAAFRGATFIYLDPDIDGTPSHVAAVGYRASWAEAIGPRDDRVAMTRLDDDDGLATWALARIRAIAEGVARRTAIILPIGIRVWDGSYDLVRHESNAMQTLVTMPGDRMNVYDYGHRDVRRHAEIRRINGGPAWLWSRHPDTISGWRTASYPITPDIRVLFPVDWSVFGAPKAQRRSHGCAGLVFR